MQPTTPIQLNRQKHSPTFPVFDTQNSIRPPSQQLTLIDIFSQPPKIFKLTSKHKNHRTTPKPGKHQSTHKRNTTNCSPTRVTAEKDISLENGIQIRRLHAKNQERSRIRRYIIREKETKSELEDEYSPFSNSFLIIQKSNLLLVESRQKNKNYSEIGLDGKFDACPAQMKAKNQRKPQKKVPFKVAARDKEWIIKAKPQITKSFNLQINMSNGINIDNLELYSTFKYYLGKGNNSKLIKQCFSSRWWWTQVTEEEKSEANLVWTQWKDLEFIESLPKLTSTHKISNFSGTLVTTSVKFFDSESKPRQVDLNSIGFNLIIKSKEFATLKTTTIKPSDLKIHNKLEYNHHLSNKTTMFSNLRAHCNSLGFNVFDIVPVTFHVKCNNDNNFKEFQVCFQDFEKKSCANLWIVKPGEDSNRGNGISVCNSIEQIKAEINALGISKEKTVIIQKYIENPFLVHKRKFDIRCYGLVTCINGVLQGYFYNEGYLRTASKPFSLQITNKFIHLTNDAVQKFSEDYGKFESGNKLSYSDFQRYLDTHCDTPLSFIDSVIPRIKAIVKTSINSVYLKLDSNRRANCFEVFGYDFLLDDELRPWLLEVNTNPCLELSSPHLARIIPNMVENALRISVDPLFQEPASYTKHFTLNEIPENKFELIFNSETNKIL